MSLRDKVLPAIGSDNDARKHARHGGNAGFVMALSSLLTIVFAYYWGMNSNREAVPANELIYTVTGSILQGAVVAYMGHRVRIGRGWIAGSLLLALWTAEMAMKIPSGTLNAGWALFHLALMTYVLNGVRGCLYSGSSALTRA